MQESFYSKLKKFADESNTNLYVSNIPKNMNEHVCCHRVRFVFTPITISRNSPPYLHLTRSVQAGYSVTLLVPVGVLVLLGES